jgi:hypothetical protein
VEDWWVSRDALTDPNDDEQVWWDVIERVFDELATPYQPDPRLERLTPGQRALYALHWTRSEVGNGGFTSTCTTRPGCLPAKHPTAQA